jgi:hypothetical protein
MALPDSYTLKPTVIPAYFDAILQAQAPQRFSIKFLESLDFKSANDRLFIGVLKDLRFLDADGVPTKRYFEFLDRSQSKQILSAAIKDAYADLFSVNTTAEKLSPEEARNKLRTLYAGAKKDGVIARIARTFTALCEYADFTPGTTTHTAKPKDEAAKPLATQRPQPLEQQKTTSLDSLQYHINIVLPESRDQAVYDAIFKSLRDHLR